MTRGSFQLLADKPNSKLLRLAYVSMVDPQTTPAIVREMARQASTANEANGITGALIYNGRNFFQIIEGPHSELRTLMRRIFHDTRHYNVQMHFDADVTERCFAGWGLQLVLPLDREGPAIPAQLDPELQKLWQAFSTLR